MSETSGPQEFEEPLRQWLPFVDSLPVREDRIGEIAAWSHHHSHATSHQTNGVESTAKVFV